jgi:hypothetical protein
MAQIQDGNVRLTMPFCVVGQLILQAMAEISATQTVLHQAIQEIARLQGADRLFPAIRHNPHWPGYRRNDDNVFFTAITVFTLQQHVRPQVSTDLQQQIDQINDRARLAYPAFQNKDGLATYNFWPTRPSRHFPNGWLFHRFDHFRIPDDIDDTAMVYLTNNPTETDRNWLKTKLVQHANGSQRLIKSTFPEYRNLRAYSTWFGKNMPVDFDVCALSNLLYCIFRYQLPLNLHDNDSLALLRGVVESGQYLQEPFRCAPHYARTSLIIYHLARLMADFGPAALEPIRAQLVADAEAELNRATNRIEKILLATSLLRLGQTPPAIDLSCIETDFNRFHFFIAGLLTAYEQPILRKLATQPFVQLRWQCVAHCWSLVAEYASLKLL